MRQIPDHTNSTIAHPRGLVLTLSLIVVLILTETLLSYLTGIGLTITSVKELLISNGLYILLFCLLVSTVQNFGGIEVGRLFFARLPQTQEVVKWGSLGVITSVPAFTHATGLPTYFEHDGYVTFTLLAILRSAVLIACIEETLFRGICFASLLRLGRMQAYSISTLLFLAWHVRLVTLIVRGSPDLTWPHTASIVVTGLTP